MSTFQIDTNRLLELASTSQAASQLLNQYYPEVFVVEKPEPTLESTIDLSNLSFRRNQFYLNNGKYLGAINQSPMHIFTFKGIIVDNAFTPSIQKVNGRDIIVFENK